MLFIKISNYVLIRRQTLNVSSGANKNLGRYQTENKIIQNVIWISRITWEARILNAEQN